METLYLLIVICFSILFGGLIIILRGMAKLKKQNDRIYEEWTEDIPYDFEFEDTSIEGIDMSVRLRNCLNAAEIDDFEQLKDYTKQELVRFRNFGKKSLEELGTLMNEHNLKFKETDVDKAVQVKDELNKCQKIAEETDEWAENELMNKLRMGIEIKELDMSARLRRCLDALEIEYLAQVTARTKKEISGYWHLGKKSLEELENLMSKYSLNFKE